MSFLQEYLQWTINFLKINFMSNDDILVFVIMMLATIPVGLFVMLFSQRWYRFWELETYGLLFLGTMISLPFMFGIYYYRTGDSLLCLQSFCLIYLPFILYTCFDKLKRVCLYRDNTRKY